MKTVRVAADKVPEDLRNRFRAWCLVHGTTLQEEFIRFMRWTVEQDRKGKID
tara:strand:+ start:463 stop:618 length:156 start_codon:yes stop_codon:yes gene_type:complete